MSSAVHGDLAHPLPQQASHVAVVCESTACLPEALASQYGIGVIPIPFAFAGRTYFDGVDITPGVFFELLARTHEVAQTSPPSPGEYIEAWKAASRSATAIISITVDSKVSTLQRSALLAQGLAPELLPGVTLAIVDSLSAGMGQGFVALAAARAAAAGRSLADVVAAAKGVSQRITLLVALDTLEYLSRASRIPQIAAFVGGVLDVKPIFRIAGGEIHPIIRVRTRRRASEHLLQLMRQAVPPGARLHVAVQHAAAAEEAAQLEARVRDMFECLELYTTEFSPVMGGYCGPGLLGVAFYTEVDGDEA